jgi:membrane-associated PAP2 superfamily phosphatase
LFYDGPKLLLAVGLFGCALSLLLGRFLPYMPRYRRGIRIVLLSLIIVPASVSALKAKTDVACPRALVEFGGQIPYVGVLHRSAGRGQTSEPQQCFPAAHASGGFALLALFFLFESPRNRGWAVSVGLVAGWAMGAYKMAIGDHFLSHTVVSMLLAWLIINLIVIADDRLQSGIFKGLQPAVNS